MKKNKMLEGIDRNVGTDLFIGVIVFVAIFLVSFIAPGFGTIGIPNLAQSIASTTGKFIVIVILAPIFETFFFFVIILSLFYKKMNLPFFVSAVISSIAFLLFHISAYGIVGTSGAFLTAGIMGMVFSYQVKLTKSVIPAIVTHALLNFVIGGFIPLSISLISLIHLI